MDRGRGDRPCGRRRARSASLADRVATRWPEHERSIRPDRRDRLADGRRASSWAPWRSPRCPSGSTNPWRSSCSAPGSCAHRDPRGRPGPAAHAGRADPADHARGAGLRHQRARTRSSARTWARRFSRPSAIPAVLYLPSIPFGEGAFGIGDVKLLVGVGLLLGLERAITGIVSGLLLSAVVLVVLLIDSPDRSPDLRPVRPVPRRGGPVGGRRTGIRLNVPDPYC